MLGVCWGCVGYLSKGSLFFVKKSLQGRAFFFRKEKTSEKKKLRMEKESFRKEKTSEKKKLRMEKESFRKEKTSEDKETDGKRN